MSLFTATCVDRIKMILSSTFSQKLLILFFIFITNHKLNIFFFPQFILHFISLFILKFLPLFARLLLSIEWHGFSTYKTKDLQFDVKA